jgi:hypothetical protein
MGDLLLMYRACGPATRDDYLRGVAEEAGLPFPCVRRLADWLDERRISAACSHLRREVPGEAHEIIR